MNDVSYALDQLHANVDAHDRPVRLIVTWAPWALILASAADLVVTRWLLAHTDGREGNPLMAAFVLSWVAVLVKIALPAIVGWRVLNGPRTNTVAVALCFAVGVYLGVLGHNFWLVTR